ncbi:hypothetical protein Tco_0689463 [Tanacetum coccineum]
MEAIEATATSETLELELDADRNKNSIDPTDNDPSSSSSIISQKDVIRAVEIVERDSIAIAESFSSLFESLRTSLSQVTSRSVDHVQCFSDAAGRLQESGPLRNQNMWFPNIDFAKKRGLYLESLHNSLDSATKGNLYINSCLRLNEEMRGIDTLAMQLKVLRRNVDALDTTVNSLVRLP